MYESSQLDSLIVTNPPASFPIGVVNRESRSPTSCSISYSSATHIPGTTRVDVVSPAPNAPGRGVIVLSNHGGWMGHVHLSLSNLNVDGGALSQTPSH